MDNAHSGIFSRLVQRHSDQVCMSLREFCCSSKVEAVELISENKAPRIVQPEEGATYDKIWKKKEVAKVMKCVLQLNLFFFLEKLIFPMFS